MTLEDFERELAAAKQHERHGNERDTRHHSKDHHHGHKYRSHRGHEEGRHRHRSQVDEDEHRHKRRRRSREGDGREKRRSHHRSRSPNRQRSHRDRTPRSRSPENRAIETDERPTQLKRDAWMEPPSVLEVEIKHHRHSSEVQPVQRQSSLANFEQKLRTEELNKHQIEEHDASEPENEVTQGPAQTEVEYTFGDSGSQWRMTRLRGVYRQAKEAAQNVEQAAIKQYGDLRLFDDAREEEIELDRRKTYGEGYVGKDKPSGELYRERKAHREHQSDRLPVAGTEAHDTTREAQSSGNAAVVDQNMLNKLKADMMRAKLRKAPNAAELEAEYERAAAAFGNSDRPDVIIMSKMDNRMLGDRGTEVRASNTKRGRERGLVEENDDMSLDDMVRAERRSKDQAGGEGALLAQRIAKDTKFDNDLEYLDENAEKLAKRIQKSEINLRNATVASIQKTTRVLDQCPLCHHEDRADPAPTAPVISLATRTYLTLPTEPEISLAHGAVLVPLQHRTNLLECDDDEWEELRNFMKSLTRMYAARRLGVLFYENAAYPNRQQHAALVAVPLPASDRDTAPGFFREAILAAAPEWAQHRKIIDTGVAATKGGMGRAAFKRSIAKQMPYFHVWFTLDGGLGHVVEDEGAWPRGDLFAREVLGEVLQRDFEVIRARGKWVRGDRRVESFRKEWDQWDWTKVLVEA